MNKMFLTAAKAVLTVVVLVFITDFILKNINKISFENININWAYIAIATIPFVAHLFLYSALWRKILGLLNVNLSLREANAIYAVSNLWRYIPGRVAMVLGRVYLCSERGISKQKCILSIILEQGFVVVGALQICLLSLIFWDKLSVEVKLLSALGLILLFVIICPTVVERVINLGIKVMKAKKERITLRYKTLFWLTIAYALTWIVQGIAFYLVIISMAGFSIKLLPISIGIFSISAIITNIAAITPGGLGVREGIIILLGAAFMPIEIATLAAIIARLSILVSEIIFLMGTKVIRYWGRQD